MADPQDVRELTQAQIDELWRVAYEQGHAAAIREMQAYLQHMTPPQVAQPIEVMPETPQVPEDTPLADLGLNARIYLVLKRAGFRTFGDIVHKTEEELLETRNLGPAGVAAIKGELRRFGYRLAE